jgi:RNA polymerase sigma factor (sigma-70 family)
MVYGVCRRALGNDADADDAFQATFLVLARKAGSSLWQESVANWLYGVAYRTALRVRGRNARRRFHETRASRSTETSSGDGVDWQEVRAVLDEELMRLPEQFRLPLVLCCLHDHTVEEAATTLHLPATTVKGRLQQGRDLLRLRLERRGITVGVGALALVAPAGMASAVPAALALSTIELAASGTVSGPVAALANEVMRMTTLTKFKWGAVALVGVCLAFGGGTMVLRTEATPLPGPVSEESPKVGKASEPVEKDGLSVTVKPTKAAFGAGETPSFVLTYTNKTDKTMRLYDLGSAIQSWNCQGLKDANRGFPCPWISQAQQHADRAGETTELAPGKHVTVDAMLVAPFIWKVNKDQVPPRNSLPTDTYQAVARVVLKPDPTRLEAEVDRRPPCWLGELMTKPVQFEVSDKIEGAKASEPAEKNGLAVTIKPTKAVFAVGEDPTFQVTYTNRAGTLTIQLHQLGGEVDQWNFTTLDGKGPWRSNPRTLDALKKIARPSPLLEPGKEQLQTYTAPGPFTWQGEQEQLVGPRDHLPAGKYRVTALLRFPDSAIKTKGIVSWSGELTTKPVEFEVSDEKAAE